MLSCIFNNIVCDFSRDMLLKMHAMLAQCEFTMEKSVQVHSVNAQEQANYEILTKDIGLCKCLSMTSTVTNVFNVFHLVLSPTNDGGQI